LEEMRGALTNSELMVLLAVCRLGNAAYGVPILTEVEKHGGKMAMATVYAALERLAAKGLVVSRLGEATPERGGKAKRYFQVTPGGLREIRGLRKTLTGLWSNVPRLKGTEA
jgi:DNA-binding PadR family transcriptional regulator